MSITDCQARPTTHPTYRRDLYSQVTDAIVAQLERGVRPWVQPWTATPLARPRRANGEAYHGINVLILWAASAEQGFTSPEWMTFRQAKEKNASVRRGAKGTVVVYAQRSTGQANAVEDADEDAVSSRCGYFLKSYTVFNSEQLDGWPSDALPLPGPDRVMGSPVDEARRFLTAVGDDIRHGGNRAHYRADSDHVQMPLYESFRDGASYCSTLAHELTH